LRDSDKYHNCDYVPQMQATNTTLVHTSAQPRGALYIIEFYSVQWVLVKEGVAISLIRATWQFCLTKHPQIFLKKICPILSSRWTGGRPQH
jgi:hypothetical protein